MFIITRFSNCEKSIFIAERGLTMIKRKNIIGMALAATMTVAAPSLTYAQDSTANMSPEEIAAELQQQFSLDPEIHNIVDANVRDGKIVLTGQLDDPAAYSKLNRILEDMEIDESMIENEVITQ